MSSMTTNSFELVIKATKDLENILVQGWGAEGKGLHEKLSSIEECIPDDTSKRIRWLASVRNRVVHDVSFSLDDPVRYEREYIRLRDELMDLNPAVEGSINKCQRAVIKESIPEYCVNAQASAIVAAARMKRESDVGFPGLAYFGVLLFVYLFSNLTATLLSGFLMLAAYSLVRIVLWCLGRKNFEWLGWVVLWGISLILAPLYFGAAVM